MAHQRDRLSRLYDKRHIFENPVFIVISKPDILKFDPSSSSFAFYGLRRSDYGKWQIERLKDPVRGDNRGLKYVVLVRDIPDRLEQGARVLNESNQSAESQYSVLRSVLHHPIT